jgi:hypothetical protein
MKHLNALSLAVLAAVAVTVFLGVGAASATVLCKTNMGTGCAETGWAYGAETELQASFDPGTSTKVTDFLSEETLDTCTLFWLEGLQANSGSSTETVAIAPVSIDQSNCSKSAANAWITALEIHRIPETNDGTVTATGNPIKGQIFGGVPCTYEGNSHVGMLKGGVEPTLEIEVVLKKSGGGFLCPLGLPGWEASYAVTSPTPLYVADS